MFHFAPEKMALSRIGLLSDSHGRATTTQRAVRLLLAHEVDLIIHLGDVGTLDVIDALVEAIDETGELSPAVHAVFGNCDWDYASLSRYAQSLGIHVAHPVGRLNLDGRVVVFQHGHQEASMNQALAEGVDYLCHGHSHRTRDEKLGSTRVVNPGALFRAAQYTVAVLDTESDRVEFLTVPED